MEAFIVHPAFEDPLDRATEAFDPLSNLRRGRPVEELRERRWLKNLGRQRLRSACQGRLRALSMARRCFHRAQNAITPVITLATPAC